MKKINISLLILLACIIFTSSIIKAQEFPITTGNYVKSPGGVAYDGTNYLIGIVGDNVNSKSITAQLLSPTGSLVGSRISIGATGASPYVAFDGTNYLMLWSNYSGSDGDNIKATDTVFGQFISTSGNLVGSHFPIFIDANISSPKGGCLVFSDSNYIIVFKRNRIDYVQSLSKTGSLIGYPLQLSQNEVNDNSIGFDGTNFLVVWASHEDYGYQQDVYGQFISKTGALVGSNFTIDHGNMASDNPVSIAYDGSRYLVAFHESSTIGWNLFAHFVTPSGLVESNRIMLRDSTYSPGFPFLNFDGTNYLVVWSDSLFTTSSIIMGRYFNTNGIPIDNEFTIFSNSNGMIPFFGMPIFNINNFLVITYRMNPQFNNGDISGKFIPFSTLGLSENIKTNSFNFYPNPSSDIINLDIESIKDNNFTLNIYNIMGALIKSKTISKNQRQINVEDLKNGIYLIEIKTNEWTKSQKLIIRK